RARPGPPGDRSRGLRPPAERPHARRPGRRRERPRQRPGPRAPVRPEGSERCARPGRARLARRLRRRPASAALAPAGLAHDPPRPGGGVVNPIQKRNAALQRFAISITAFTIAGAFLLGFEDSWAQPLAALATAYPLELALESFEAWAQRR